MDLPNSLAGDVQFLAYLFESFFLGFIIEAEAQAKDFKFTFRQNLKTAGNCITEIDLGVFFHGVDGAGIGQKIHEASLIPFRA